jgi:hypothetical protein
MQVFISHASADHLLAEELVLALRDARVSVWNPYEVVLPGDNMALAIGRALEQCEVMVVLMTSAANQSPNVRNEVQFALTRGNYRGRVIPVFLDYETFKADGVVPWILMRLDPIYVNGPSPDFSAVASRVLRISEAASNATA